MFLHTKYSVESFFLQNIYMLKRVNLSMLYKCVCMIVLNDVTMNVHDSPTPVVAIQH